MGAGASSDTIEMTDGIELYRFRAVTRPERKRALSMFTKEVGTIAWIREVVKPGEVFIDVGANVGLYSVFAASRVQATGAVYAFEPHVPTFHTLLINITLNGLSHIITPLVCALHEEVAALPFNYLRLDSGSSGSQLGGMKDGNEQPFVPVATELKWATSLDEQIERATIRQPDHVKIDVDGNELPILLGMRKLLTNHRRPKTLQVEINARSKSELLSFLRDVGYIKYHRHDTALGKKAIAAGQDPEAVAHNALFRPAE